MYACICRQITEADVRRVGRSGIRTPQGLIAALGLDDPSCCGRCAADVDHFVELAVDGVDAAPERGPACALLVDGYAHIQGAD